MGDAVLRDESTNKRDHRRDRQLSWVVRGVLFAVLGGCSFSSKAGVVVDSATSDAATDGASTVDGRPSSDAMIGTDAALFDPSTCPSTFTTQLPSFPAARYRILTSNAVFASHHGTCKAAELTHLVVLDTQQELAELWAVLPAGSPPTNGWYFAGGVQTANQPATDAAWRWLTGGAVDPVQWGVFNNMPQPNDADGVENNVENIAIFDTAQGKLIDGTGMNGYGAVCECDGKAILAAVENEIP
jgi:hypothetical protein